MNIFLHQKQEYIEAAYVTDGEDYSEELNLFSKPLAIKIKENGVNARKVKVTLWIEGHFGATTGAEPHAHRCKIREAYGGFDSGLALTMLPLYKIVLRTRAPY